MLQPVADAHGVLARRPPLTSARTLPCATSPLLAAAEFLYAEETLPPVVALAWHPASTHLAVLPRGQSFAVVWTAAGGTARVDSGLKVGAAGLAGCTARACGMWLQAWALSTRASPLHARPSRPARHRRRR